MKKIKNIFLNESKGFTLIEILIAIAILATILTTIYASFTGTFRNIKGAESQVEVYRMARIAFERIVEDLESAYILERSSEEDQPAEDNDLPGFIGEDDETDGRSRDSIQFYSRAHLDLKDLEIKGMQTRISYYVDENEEGETLTLYRADTLKSQLEDESQAGLVLCNELYSVDFKYLNNKGESLESWDSTSDQSGKGLPAMVTIRLEFANMDDLESPYKFMTGVSIPMARSQYGSNPAK
jgi:prepilin-type N-terminal cleavage/methylation domain-containing protein